jgi:heterodisulfide reductase subunit A
MCGLAHYPKPIEESIAQAQAAVSRAVTILSRDEMWLSGTVAFIDQNKCVGCGVCWTVCPYQAIDQNETGLAVVNEALCKGCGTCVASCRSGAPNLRGFTTRDVMAQIEAMM